MYKTEPSDILIIPELGSRRFSNYWWAVSILFASIGFLYVSLSSFLAGPGESIFFFPQRILMLFYGLIGLFFSLYLWLIIFWDIGQGYNEFNKKIGVVRLFRQSFPGKTRRLQITCLLSDIQSINISVKTTTNSLDYIFLQLSNQTTLSLTPEVFEKLEDQASYLASFLNLSLKEL